MFTLILFESNSDGDVREEQFADFDNLRELEDAGEELKFTSTEDGWIVDDFTFEEV